MAHLDQPLLVAGMPYSVKFNLTMIKCIECIECTIRSLFRLMKSFCIDLKKDY